MIVQCTVNYLHLYSAEHTTQR